MINVCFHGIGVPQRELEDGEAPYWVDVTALDAILDELATWPGVSLSFDDGNASDVTIALPALLSRGLTASFFVLAGRLGRAGSLGGEDVAELVAQGMGIGTHGMNHRPWRGLDRAARQGELIDARQRIEDVAGTPVSEAACPLGRYDRRLLADLHSLGYRRVYTSDQRRAAPGSWLQPRFSVRCDDTVTTMRARMLARPGPVRLARDAAVGLVKRVR